MSNNFYDLRELITDGSEVDAAQLLKRPKPIPHCDCQSGTMVPVATLAHDPLMCAICEHVAPKFVPGTVAQAWSKYTKVSPTQRMHRDKRLKKSNSITVTQPVKKAREVAT